MSWAQVDSFHQALKAYQEKTGKTQSQVAKDLAVATSGAPAGMSQELVGGLILFFAIGLGLIITGVLKLRETKPNP